MTHSISCTAAVHAAIATGRMKLAKRLIQYKCRTLPEVQAYRLATVVGEFVDPEGSYECPDYAVLLLNEFNPRDQT